MSLGNISSGFIDVGIKRANNANDDDNLGDDDDNLGDDDDDDDDDDDIL